MRSRWQWSHAVPASGDTMTTSMRGVHERLVRFGSEPVSDPDAPWQDLRCNLPDRPLSWSGRLMAWLRRPAIAMMTTGLLSTGVAHAAGVQPVRSGVDWLVGGVTSIVGAKNEPRLERETQPRQGQGGFRDGAGSFEENRRRMAGGTGVESDQEREPGGDGRGRAPAPAGAGSRGDEDREEPRDDDREEREDDDDGDEREERDDGDDDGRSEPGDEEVEEPEEEELEEPEDEPTEADRDSETDERDALDSDSHDEVELEEDRG